MGGIMFSESFGGTKQVIEWTKYVLRCSLSQYNAYHIHFSFLGSNAFCLKACDPAGPNAAHFCEHVYDRIGCAFNAPNAAVDKVFESCDAENADYPGVYTTNGQVVTYTQPPESLGAISTMPYVARVPSSSNCKTLTSSQLFAGLPTASSTSTGTSAAATGKTTSKTGSGSTTPTGTGKPAQTSSSDASTLAISGVSFLGVVFSALFLA